MIRLADIVDEFRGDLKAQYADQLLPSHDRALDAIVQCRTTAVGTSTWRCDDCKEVKTIPLSCGHRSCPTCQHHESCAWLDRQLEKSLPTQYYMVTFTVPAQLRNTVYRNQSTMYSILFKTAIATLKGFGAQTKRLDGELGLVAVLHTHNRKLDYHPHVHVVLPGLAIQGKDKSIRRYQGKYLFNVKSLGKVFRAKMLQAINEQELSVPVGMPTQWNVHCKRVGGGEKTLTYLARYLYRGVISEQRILSVNNGEVEYEYLCSETKVYQRRKLPAAKFLYKLLQHVLPRGFQRARSYGFLHHNCRVLLKRIQLLLQVVAPERLRKKRSVNCPACKGAMKLVNIWRAEHPARKRTRHNADQISPLLVDVDRLTQRRRECMVPT